MILKDNQIPNNWEELGQIISFIKSTLIDNLRFPDDDLFYENYLKYVDKKTRLKILFNTFEGKDRVILRPSFSYNNQLKKIPILVIIVLGIVLKNYQKIKLSKKLKINFLKKSTIGLKMIF